jgi:serine/threonine-protein kinase
MSDSTIPPGSPDRNLLFGVMALHLDFVGKPDLLQGLQTWGVNQSRPLGDILVDRCMLSSRRRMLLEEVVEEYLVQYDHDASRGLVAACSARAVELDIGAFANSPMRGNLLTLPSEPLTVAGPGSGDPPPPSHFSGMVNSTGKRFRIIRPHARGALGEVYLARDEELHRDVALKEIQAPYAAHPDSRARFIMEAEITGSLEHPGIVPVYGLNVHPDGRPYYAMRFIKGESLYEAIAAFHQADLPSRDLTERTLAMRGLLTRFVAVCNAIEYAHSKGVIHRDIKPSNIMLGPYGETLVVDWGLAKAAGRAVTSESREIPIRPSSSGSARATMLGQAVGTPSFMPPEQAAGKVDAVGPRSDVYSLGGTLYNILTGMPPFPGDDADEVIEQVLTRQLVPPRRVKRDTPPPLEAIVLKAMRFDSRDRYASASELAQEVERWLADEPVRAYPEPAFQRLRRWTRRHRTFVSGVGVLFLTTLVALGLGLLAVGREQRRTAKERDNALRNLKLARKAVDDCFQVTREDTLLQQEKNRAVRRLLLEKALPFYQDFKSQSPDNLELLAEEGSNFYRVASITAEIDDKSKAVQWYQKARSNFSSLADRNPEARSDLARVDNDFAKLQHELGKRRDAEALFEEAIVLLEALVASDNSPDDERELASALNNLAVLRREEDKFEEALKLHKRALDLQESLAKANPRNRRYQADLGNSQHNLGRFLAAQGKWNEARVAYVKAEEIRSRLVEKEPSQLTFISDLADTRHNLGELYREMKKPEKAIRSFELALEMQSKLAYPYSEIPEHHLSLASTYNAIGVLRREAGELVKAREMYQSALQEQKELAIRQPGLPQCQIELAGTCNNFGQLIRELDDDKQGGKLPEAFDWYRRAFAHLRKVPAPERNPRARQVLCEAHAGRADVWYRLGKYHSSISDWQEATRLDNGGNVAWFRQQKAFAIAKVGDHGQAMNEVTDLEKAGSLEGRDLFNLACICALSSGAARQDMRLPQTERKRLMDSYARRALLLLRRAHAKTDLFKDVEVTEKLLKDEDLKSLQRRPDFLELKAELLRKAG